MNSKEQKNVDKINDESRPAEKNENKDTTEKLFTENESAFFAGFTISAFVTSYVYYLICSNEWMPGVALLVTVISFFVCYSFLEITTKLKLFKRFTLDGAFTIGIVAFPIFTLLLIPATLHIIDAM